MFREKIFFLSIFLTPLALSSTGSLAANDLIYGEGSTEVNTQINEYAPVVANKPIQGTIFITHEAKNAIDVNSFRIGNKPLKVSFVQTSQMSSSSSIYVTIYSFELEGLPTGTHTLSPIVVKIGGKEVQALPLVIEVN